MLSKKQECEARNKLAPITHHAVCYINSHFHMLTRKEMKTNPKNSMPPTENGIPSCESGAISGMCHFPPLKYPLHSFFS